MSQQRQRIERPRSFSAKPTANRSRPVSGMTHRVQAVNMKTQLLSTIYQGRQKSPWRKNPSKTLLLQGFNTEDILKTKRSTSKLVSKSKQQVYQQNLQLKREINKLNEELSIVRGKAERNSKSKKVLERNKQLDIEFEKEVFWSGTKSHMISGIKHQYEKLKKQYTELSKQHNELKISMMSSKTPQYRIYTQQVERQNKRLAQKLAQILQQQENTLRGMQSTSNKQVSEFMLLEAEQRIRLYQQKIEKLEEQLKKTTINLKDREKKIEFLEKLLIEKDNSEYHMGRKIKKLEKEKENMDQGYKDLEKKSFQKQKQYETEIKNLKIQHDQEKTILQAKAKSILNEKDNQIKYLEEENKELEITITKLRMMPSTGLHNTSNINMNSNLNYGDGAHRKKDSTLNSNSGVGKMKVLDSLANKRELSGSKLLDNIDLVAERNMNSQHEAWEEGSENDKEEKKKFRIMQKADKKHSQASKKVRKVQFSEVQQLGQIIKYRMMFFNIQPRQMRKFFSYKSSIYSNKTSSDANFIMKQKNNEGYDEDKSMQQNLWEAQYITMGQTQNILQNHPFNLQEEQAYLLARYIIEDCEEEYVYSDPGNQNTRDIVKSIVKALVGQYHLPTSQSKQQTKQFMDNYQTNFQSSLTTYYPNGKVTKKKFLDTLNGLGIEISEEVQENLLAKVITKSKNLQQLEYRAIFIPDVRHN